MYQVVTMRGGVRKRSNKNHTVSGGNFRKASVISFEITERNHIA